MIKKYLIYGVNKVEGWKKSMENFALDFIGPVQGNVSNVYEIFELYG